MNVQLHSFSHYTTIYHSMVLLVFLASTILLLHLYPPESFEPIAWFIAGMIISSLLHEAIHWLAARILGVKGVQLRFTKHLKIRVVVRIDLDYEYMRRSEFIYVALAPQALNLLYLLLSIVYDTVTIKLLSLGMLVGNIAGAFNDFVDAYVAYRNPHARRFTPLLNSNGDIVGIVAEHDNTIKVFTYSDP